MNKNTNQKNSTQRLKVNVGDVLPGAPITQIRANDAGERKSVMLDVGGGLWGRLLVSQFGAATPNERDALIAAAKLGDRITVKVTGIDTTSGKHPLVELSAKELVMAKIKEERAAEKVAREQALAALTAGTLVTGKVVGFKDYGAFVQLDQFHTGLLHVSEQLIVPDERPAYLQEGDDIEVAIMSTPERKDRKLYIPLSELQAVEVRRQQAFAQEQAELRASLTVGGFYAATTDTVSDNCLIVSIGGLIKASLPDSKLLDPRKKPSIARKGQHLYVEVTAIDGEVIEVKQTSKKIIDRILAERAQQAAAEAAAQQATAEAAPQA